MISKCFIYACVATLFVLASFVSAASFNTPDLAESGGSNSHAGEEASNNKPKYILKCFDNKHDCSILEVLPETILDSDVAADEMTGEMAKRSEESSQVSRAHLRKLIKRIFPTADLDPQQASRLYKTDKVNCLTGDCSLQTVRINKRRNMGTLACVGDPYSSSGSRCLPIEGLYIG